MSLVAKCLHRGPFFWVQYSVLNDPLVKYYPEETVVQEARNLHRIASLRGLLSLIVAIHSSPFATCDTAA